MSIVEDLSILFFISIFFIFLIIRLYIMKRELLIQRKYFIKTLSHDLRVSVLAQLRGLDLLTKNRFSESEKDEILSEVANGCKYTFDMITMLADTYRYETEKILPVISDIGIKSLINTIVSEYSSEVSAKGLNFYTPKMSCTCQAEKNSFSKALKILISTAISNAYKSSAVKFNYRTQKDTFIFQISYTGIPITDEEKRRMFSNDSDFSTVGHGIKMYLCKKIIDFHSGNINVTCYNNNLTIFTIKLPMKNKNAVLKHPYWKFIPV